MKVLRKIRVYLSVMYAYMNEYRAELLLWALAQTLPFIFLGAWTKAASQDALAFSPAEFAQYFVAVFIVRQLTLVWVIYEFEQSLLHGSFSHELLKPIDPIWRHVAEHVAERFARLPFSILIMAAALVMIPQARVWPSALNLLLASILCACAFVLRFVIQYAFAMLTFWIEKASAIERLWSLAYVFLSGLIAPMALFPQSVRALVEYTPFPLLIHAPAVVLMGKEAPSFLPFLKMGAWALGFFIVGRVLYARGLKKYSAMGA